MKNSLMSVSDKVILRKRSIIETINDELKNMAQVEHSRQRLFHNFVNNLISGLAAYCLFLYQSVTSAIATITSITFHIVLPSTILKKG